MSSDTLVTQETRLDVLAALRATHTGDVEALRTIVEHTPGALALLVQALRLADLLAVQWVGEAHVEELLDRLVAEEFSEVTP